MCKEVKCVAGKTVQVCKSGMGYYCGTFDDDGPNCRVSGYAKTREACESMLANPIMWRECAENLYCAQCHGHHFCIEFDEEE